MNHKNSITIAAVLAFLSCTSGLLKAIPTSYVTNVVTITATAVVQSGTNDSGTKTTITTSKVSVTTKQLLAWLAVDENAEANYPATNFPSGAQLMLIVINGNVADFQVYGKTNNLLVDVSDILGASHGSHAIVAGNISDTTHVYDPSVTQSRLFNFTYDDSELPDGKVGLDFDLTGVEIKTLSDTVPKSGIYTQTISTKIESGVGDGTYQSRPFVITGGMTFSGKQSLSQF